MWKTILLKLLIPLLPTIFDMLLKALANMARRTDNTIDDQLVETLRINKKEVITEIKKDTNLITEDNFYE